MRAFLFFLFFVMAGMQSFAQVSGSIKVAHDLKKGYEYTLKKNYAKAEKSYLKSIRKNPRTAEAYFALGTMYQTLSEFEKESWIYSLGYQHARNGKEIFSIPYAGALYRNREFTKANEILQSWKKGKNVSESKSIQLLEAGIQLGEKSMSSGNKPIPQNMGMRINSRYDEYFPSITANDSTLVFTRKTNGIDEDFYVAKRDSCGGWFRARDMGSPPNSPQQEGAQMLSADGHYLFFMRCENRSWNGWQEGGCDLYFSYTKDGGWSQPVPFRGMINTLAYEGTPSLSSDNRIMYFSSDREGGYGGLDIWMTVFKDGLWQIPVNLGPEINTAGNDFAPWIAADNKTLYFSSDGHPGFGGMDIYQSRLQADHSWSKAENLGYPLNSAADDISLCLSADGKKAYYSSNRKGGFGGMDLYEIALEEKIQPEPLTILYGIVHDSLSKDLVTYAQIEWSDAETGEPLYHFQSNRGDASFTSAIKLNQKFALRVYRSGYLDYHDTLSFHQSIIFPPDTFNIALLPNYYEPPLSDSLLFRYFFVKNEAKFDDSTIIKVKRLVAPFLEKEHSIFFVNGFTDDSGTPDINENVSFARARLIGEILFNLGIPESKIHLQGWSEANPLAPNTTEENRKMNRRVELTVRFAKEGG